MDAVISGSRQAFQIWKSVVLGPNLETFEAERHKAKLSTAIIWMAVVGFVGTLIGSFTAYLVFLASRFQGGAFTPFGSYDLGVLSGLGLIVILVNSVLAIVSTPVALLIISGVLYLLAKLLGGRGDFAAQTYLLATFAAPIWLAIRIVWAIPTVGWVVVIGLGIYQIYLGHLAVRAAHRLRQARSLAVVLAPAIAGASCLGAAILFQFWIMSHFSGSPRVGFIFKPSPKYPAGCPPACAGVDFSGTNLFRVDLNEADLSGADLSGVDAREAGLWGANLSSANLSETDLMRATLEGADLRGADLTGSDLRHVWLHEARIDDSTRIGPKWRLAWEIVNYGSQGRDLRGVDLSGTGLGPVDLSGMDLSDSNLSDTSLPDAVLSNANLSGADLSYAWMPRADLSDADLSGTNLSHADLRGANLVGIRLNNTSLSGANLGGTDLQGYDLSGYNLKDAYLSGANLRDVDFRNANLTWADLSEADLRGAILDGADLSNANLYQAQVTDGQLSKVKSLAETTMPDGSTHE